jgi:hypothetical protein
MFCSKKTIKSLWISSKRRKKPLAEGSAKAKFCSSFVRVRKLQVTLLAEGTFS